MQTDNKIGRYLGDQSYLYSESLAAFCAAGLEDALSVVAAHAAAEAMDARAVAGLWLVSTFRHNAPSTIC